MPKTAALRRGPDPEASRASVDREARAALAVLAGAAAMALLAALAARMTGWTWLAVWVLLVPWLLALEGLRSLGAALAAGLLGAVLFTLAVLGWLAAAITTYTGAPAPLALLVLVLSAPLLEPQLVVVAIARAFARRRGAGRIHTAVLSAALYVAAEWTCGKLFGDTLAYGLYPARGIRQAADLAGASGLTFLAVLGNECVVAALARAGARAPLRLRARRALAPLAAFAALLLALSGYGRARLAALERGDRGELLTVAAVQAGIADYAGLRAELGTYEAVRRILAAHFELSTRAAGSGAGAIDLLVWPETVYPTTYGAPKSADGAAFDREIAVFVATLGVPLAFGSYVAAAGKEFNAAVFLEPRAGGAVAVASYRKQRPFPFTERTPALLDHAAVRNLLPWLGTWGPGNGPEPSTRRSLEVAA